MAVCVFFEAAERIIDRGPRFPPRIRTTSVFTITAPSERTRRDSIHASLRSSIRLPFYFFPFLSGFSLCHSVHSDISFSLYRVVRRVYESNIRQSDTRNDRGKPQRSNGGSTCFAARNAGASRDWLMLGKF